MSLRLRLTLAYLVLVLQFLLVGLGLFWMLGGYDIVVLYRPPVDQQHNKRLKQPLMDAYQAGGWTSLEHCVRFNFFPPDSSLLLFRDGKLVFHRGPHRPGFEATPPGPHHRDLPDRREVWLPLETDPPSIACFVFPQRRPPWFSNPRLQAILAASVAFSGLFTLLAGLVASSAIAGPAAKLKEAIHTLEQQEFAHPIEVAEHGELRELAASFNSMAARLDDTIRHLREAKERAERSESSRKQLMVETSHNLRTPLAAVQGWTEALLDGVVQGEEIPYLKKIRRETVHVAQVVQRLVDWARWEDVAPMLSESEFPVSEPLLETLEAVQEVAESRSTRIALHGLESEPRVRGDRTRVRDLFQILVENAVQHTPPGTCIEVEFVPLGQRLQVTVSDNGPGLPEEYRRELSCRCGGGLGLAIAERLARAHGSALEALEGPGTRLRFSLALAEKFQGELLS